MKTDVRRKDLVDALRVVCAVVPKRSNPGLQWLRMEPRGQGMGQLVLSATGLDMAIHRSIDADIRTPATAIVVEAKPLYAMVRKVRGEVLTLEADGHNLHVRSEGAAVSFPLQVIAEYPPLPTFGGPLADVPIAFQVDAGRFQQMIEQTAFAVATENSRYAIHGVLLEAASRTVNLVATDRNRIAVATGRADRDIPKDGFKPAIVPPAALNLLSKVKLPTDAVVDVDAWPLGEKGRMIGFRSDGVVVIAVVNDGCFPHYRDVIPSGADKRAELPVDDLRAALESVDVATNYERKGCRFAFRENLLTLTVEEGGSAVATARVPIQYRGPAADIGFNPSYVLDVLKACGADAIDFAWNAPNRPGLFTVGEPNSVDGYTYVLMPVYVADIPATVAA